MREDRDLNAIFSNQPDRVARRLDERSRLLEQRWDDDYRPLHWAALYGCDQVVDLLLARGANPAALISVPLIPASGDSNVWYDHQQRQVRDGWSPRDVALDAGFFGIAARLEAAGAPCRVKSPGLNVAWWQERAASYRRQHQVQGANDPQY